MALQLRTGLIDRTIAETAVGAAFGSDGVVGVICVLICYALIQIFHELGSTIVQVVHIAAKAIAVDAAIAVHGAAGITHCLGPVVAGVVGILTGGTIQNNTFPLTAEQSAVRVHDIAGQCRFSISGIFGLSPSVICFFTSTFADLHGAFCSGGVRIRSVCFIGHTGRDRGLHGGIKGSRKSVSEEAGFLPYVLLMTRCPTGLGGIHP